MKTKLFIGLILTLLSLVAYQKYSEYSALKSIDSYEACRAQKSSSYTSTTPSFCSTRLGANFVESTPTPTPPSLSFPTAYGWKKYLDYSTPHSGFNFEYPDFMSNPTFDRQGSEYYMSSGYFPNNISLRVKGPYPDTINKELISWIKEQGWPSQEGELQEMAGVNKVSYKKLNGSQIVQSTFRESGMKSPRSWMFYFRNQSGIYRIDLDTPGTEEELEKYQTIFPQILSTFKFTD